MKRFPTPCAQCGVLSYENLCPAHLAQAKTLHEIRRQQVKKATGQYSGDYRKRAKAIRDTAITCHLCGEGARNPTGRFVIGGPDGDTGLTGRKIIVDTYGGYAPHGGGAFSGKDPTKVDRSAAYMMRYLAKNIVASGKADWATCQISYAIGVEQPMSFYVETADAQQGRELTTWIQNNVDLRPRGIIERFDLFRPIYSQTTNYGHFGKPTLPWERVDLFSDGDKDETI